MNNHLRTILVWLVFLGVVVIAYQIFATASEQRKDLDTSEFYKLVDAGEIQEVNVSGDAVGYDIQGKFKTPQLTATGQQVPNFRVYTVKDEALMQKLMSESSLNMGAGAEASFVFGDFGGSAVAEETFSSELYTDIHTHLGVALELLVSGAWTWPNKELNEAPAEAPAEAPKP